MLDENKFCSKILNKVLEREMTIAVSMAQLKYLLQCQRLQVVQREKNRHRGKVHRLKVALGRSIIHHISERQKETSLLDNVALRRIPEFGLRRMLG